MNKILVFDMDGTIADLYKVNGWLEDLRSFNPRPYNEAEPMYDMEVLVDLLLALKSLGWKIVVTSWLSKESTKAYDEMVRVAKRNWLARYNFPADEIQAMKRAKLAKLRKAKKAETEDEESDDTLDEENEDAEKKELRKARLVRLARIRNAKKAEDEEETTEEIEEDDNSEDELVASKCK